MENENNSLNSINLQQNLNNNQPMPNNSQINMNNVQQITPNNSQINMNNVQQTAPNYSQVNMNNVQQPMPNNSQINMNNVQQTTPNYSQVNTNNVQQTTPNYSQVNMNNVQQTTPNYSQVNMNNVQQPMPNYSQINTNNVQQLRPIYPEQIMNNEQSYMIGYPQPGSYNYQYANSDMNYYDDVSVNQNPLDMQEYTEAMEDTSISTHKFSLKKIVIIISVVVVMGLGFLFFISNYFSLFNTHENTTGSSEYKDSSVDLNCVYESTEDGIQTKIYSDFIFNYSTKADDGKEYNYKVKIFNKRIINYLTGLSDEEYAKYVKSLNSIECLDTECTGNYLELGITEYGWDTAIYRMDDRIEFLYYNLSGRNKQATKKEKKEIRKKYEDAGFVCH